eukprot:27181-Chlamydomonas_euryale.AAC.2
MGGWTGGWKAPQGLARRQELLKRPARGWQGGRRCSKGGCHHTIDTPTLNPKPLASPYFNHPHIHSLTHGCPMDLPPPPPTITAPASPRTAMRAMPIVPFFHQSTTAH